nr:hypothetical protein [Bradyrhizobium sp. 2S1]MCK7670765.1 hypothetical protein [Bradyrhizobium sp. 2S1]
MNRAECRLEYDRNIGAWFGCGINVIGPVDDRTACRIARVGNNGVRALLPFIGFLLDALPFAT